MIEKDIPETFSGVRYPLYEQLYTPGDQVTQKEVEAIIDLARLQPNDRILDVCCGSGRHALLLTKKKYSVDGIDVNPVAIEQAQQSVAHLPLPHPLFYLGDVRQLPRQYPTLSEQYDVALNLFSSFGYYNDDQDQIAVLKAINHVLKPGGKLLLDLPNKEFIINNFQPTSEFRVDDLNATVTRVLINNRSRITTTTIVTDGKKREELPVAMNIYDLSSISPLLRQGGFVITDIRRDFIKGAEKFTPGDPTCRRMLILAKKQ
jgi:SAM-dependent methyltransferase